VPALTVLLPCYNEEQALPSLLAALRDTAAALAPERTLNVLVVDDGSADNTAEIARRTVPGLDTVVVQHETNLGLGAALATGVRWFLTHHDEDADVLAVMDADGTHPPALLGQMLARLAGETGTAPCDVVIASRYAPGGEEHGLSTRRRFYSRTASRVLALLAPIRGARDYTCGYRLYRRETLAAAAEHYRKGLVTERSFVCMAELLIKLGRRGARVDEVPLKLHYELKEGASKLNVPATIWRYGVLVAKLLFTRHFR